MGRRVKDDGLPEDDEGAIRMEAWRDKGFWAFTEAWALGGDDGQLHVKCKQCSFYKRYLSTAVKRVHPQHDDFKTHLLAHFRDADHITNKELTAAVDEHVASKRDPALGVGASDAATGVPGAGGGSGSRPTMGPLPAMFAYTKLQRDAWSPDGTKSRELDNCVVDFLTHNGIAFNVCFGAYAWRAATHSVPLQCTGRLL